MGTTKKNKNVISFARSFLVQLVSGCTQKWANSAKAGKIDTMLPIRPVTNNLFYYILIFYNILFNFISHIYGINLQTSHS